MIEKDESEIILGIQSSFTQLFFEYFQSAFLTHSIDTNHVIDRNAFFTSIEDHLKRASKETSGSFNTFIDENSTLSLSDCVRINPANNLDLLEDRINKGLHVYCQGCDNFSAVQIYFAPKNTVRKSLLPNSSKKPIKLEISIPGEMPQVVYTDKALVTFQQLWKALEIGNGELFIATHSEEMY